MGAYEAIVCSNVYIFSHTISIYRCTTQRFWCAKLIGILVGLIIIPMLYYTYTGALGVFADWFNIAIFFIAAAASYILESYILKYKKRSDSPRLCFIIICVIGIAFIIFTFKTPQIPLFEDGLSGTYGVNIVQGMAVGELHPV